MGANAQTTVPTFTAGQVLTAAQQNDSARTGVPVFASTVTRDAGFGGSGEKTLAEGQLCYVEGTGLQTYNGTAWVTWGAAPSSGLTLISTTTIGSAVSSVTVSNAFSSTYDNYKIWISGGVASTGNYLSLKLGASTTGYYMGYSEVNQTTGVATSENNNNTSTWTRVGSGGSQQLHATLELSGPFLSRNTLITGACNDAAGTTSRYYAGFLNDTTSYTAFTIATSTGTITGGTIKVYGYQNS